MDDETDSAHDVTGVAHRKARDPWREHRRARAINNITRRGMDRRNEAGGLYTLEELAGITIRNAQPPTWGRLRWASWCAYVALTGRRPPAWRFPRVRARR